MHVLVTVASRHGSTFDIATMIGAELERFGIEVTVAPPEMIDSVDEYDAVILGSAVYIGRWLESARDFVERMAASLAGRPVWLFSSGPVGEPLKPHEEAADVAPIAALVNARAHHVFSGRVDPDTLGIGERAILSLVRAQSGDFRRWEDVRAWSASVASELANRHLTVPGQAMDRPFRADDTPVGY